MRRHARPLILLSCVGAVVGAVLMLLPVILTFESEDPTSANPIDAIEEEAALRERSDSHSAENRRVRAKAVAIARRVNSHSSAPPQRDNSGVELSGTVLDASGGIIGGAQVRAHLEGQREWLTATVSDSSGNFSLRVPRGWLELQADAEAYSSASQLVQAPAHGVPLALVPSSSISGLVVASGSHQPISAAVVMALPLDPPGSGVRAETDANGSFRFEGLRAGAYRMRLETDGWSGDDVHVRVAVAEANDSVTLVARRTATLEGAVSISGGACRHGNAEASGPVVRSASTDSQGRLRISGLSRGTYVVTIRCEPGLPLQETVEITAERVFRTWALDAGLSVHGRVESVDGLPMPAVLVGVHEAPSVSEVDSLRSVQCSTNDSGEFDCNGLTPGRYDVQLLELPSETVSVDVEPGMLLPVVLRARAAGTLRVVLRQRESAAQIAPVILAESASMSPTRMVAQDDAYVLEHVPLDTYRIAFGQMPAKGLEVAVLSLARNGEVAETQLDMPKGTALRGTVVDSQGDPVPDAWVRAAAVAPRVAFNASRSVLTADTGAFVFDNMAPGVYDLTVTSSAGQGRYTGVASGAEDLSVVIQAYGALFGRVVTARGGPVGRFDLSYRSDAGDTGQITGYDGSWCLPELTPGAYHLSARSADGVAMTTVDVAQGQRVAATLIVNQNESIE